jgi:hypothetical protein
MSTKRDIKYKTVDMFKNEDLPSEIEYIQGNCETFDFVGYDNIILSHVFEHLYCPNMFIENIQKCKVSTVFISIPNFELLLHEKSNILIHSQHTYYCGFDYIIYMFSLYNYKCESFYKYEGEFKSIMFKFVLEYNSELILLPKTDTMLYKQIYIDKFEHLNSIEIPINSYIIPSGIYGQFCYYFLKNKENIVGFLDNNEKRHNKKLYGTNKNTYSPLNIDYHNSTIILCDCPYKDEIINGLNKIANSINFIFI